MRATKFWITRAGNQRAGKLQLLFRRYNTDAVYGDWNIRVQSLPPKLHHAAQTVMWFAGGHTSLTWCHARQIKFI
ncbi:MAG: hypothetical protein QM504_01605 [Pseudomonadota bacterium]